MKNVVSATTALGASSMGIAFATVADFRCQNCDSTNIKTFNYLFPINLWPTGYCPECGINLNSQRYDLACDISCGNTNEFAGVGQVCCQVPFSNRELTTKSNKPNLEILKLKF